MNRTAVTREGLEGVRPGREALPGGTYVVEGLDRERRARKRRGGEEEFTSYYGRPVIKAPVWEPREIAGYFFLGGLAGASSLLAAGAELSGQPTLARGAKLGAAGAIGLSLVALVKDLGRPARFLNMLRVFKPTSPMSVGTWLLSAYAPAAGVAALGEVVALPLGATQLATGVAALLGPGVAAYTGVLVADTAVPVWHGAFRELPFLFVASAATAAAGLGLVTAADADAGPPRQLAALGVIGDLVAEGLMERDLGELSAYYRRGRAGVLMRASKVLALSGAAGALLGRRHRALRTGSGLALLAASACTRFAVFFAGRASAEDPAATVKPQRERLARAAEARG